MYTPLGCSLHTGLDPYLMAQLPRLSVRDQPRSPGAKSPFALSGCYPLRGGVSHHLERHYPLIIALTGSCARPKPSRCFRSPYAAGLCRLSPVPAGSWPFPTLSPQVFPQVPGPLPRWDPMVHMPVSSHRTSAFPKLQEGRLPHLIRTATSVRDCLRGCSHSVMFRPPGLLTTQVAPTAVPHQRNWAAVTFTSEHPTVRYLPVSRIY